MEESYWAQGGGCEQDAKLYTRKHTHGYSNRHCVCVSVCGWVRVCACVCECLTVCEHMGGGNSPAVRVGATYPPCGWGPFAHHLGQVCLECHKPKPPARDEHNQSTSLFLSLQMPLKVIKTE